ncbi:MAG: cbb3-type cytochrome oxidase assembly protein CcoS [Myxococcota bacterium]
MTSFLWITIPATLLLASSLLGWVVYEVLAGTFDDLEGSAQRAILDDDRVPEHTDLTV